MALSAWTSDAYFVNAEQSARWFDIVHTESIMMRLLPVVPMASGTLNFPMFSAGVTAGWQSSEGATKADSKPTPTEVSIEAKLCYVLSAISKQLAADSFPGAQEALIEHAAKALAAEIDDKILEGDGNSGTIAGFYNNGSLNTEAYATDHATTFSKAINAVEQAGGTPNFVIVHPITYGLMREELKNSNFINDPSAPGPMAVWGIPVYTHRALETALGSGSDETWSLVGDAGGALIGTRGEPEVLVSETAYIDGVSMMETNQVALRIEARVGLGIARPTFFTKVTGLPTS